jgi:hypothetical protein
VDLTALATITIVRGGLMLPLDDVGINLKVECQTQEPCFAYNYVQSLRACIDSGVKFGQNVEFRQLNAWSLWLAIRTNLSCFDPPRLA